MNNFVFGKTVENLRNRIEQRKRVFEMDVKAKLYLTNHDKCLA